jgi:hypothetical protein
VCGTDLQILEGQWLKALPWPFTLGHGSPAEPGRPPRYGCCFGTVDSGIFRPR